MLNTFLKKLKKYDSFPRETIIFKRGKSISFHLDFSEYKEEKNEERKNLEKIYESGFENDQKKRRI